MNLCAKTEYACVALLELSHHFGSATPVQAKAIATQHKIPQRFLVQILLQLKSAGLVASTRGAAGGYQLVRDPAEISLADVRMIIEGPREESAAPAGASWATRSVREAWCEATQREESALQEITFAELAASAAEEDGMYYI